jgi:hypothetical protein
VSCDHRKGQTGRKFVDLNGRSVEQLLLDSSEKMLVENNRWYLFKIAALGDLETAQKISAAAIIDASKAWVKPSNKYFMHGSSIRLSSCSRFKISGSNRLRVPSTTSVLCHCLLTEN